ncbi:MAG: tRNA (N6-isopentenyl adenosine(37)-C2)-methylthiotransferase MiaB [Deltaproteobacteria bacterium]|nr:tRNA (N6-isopentenyl adenosine(37)-C2)-methylthiotransferase MiaB [Deltaproteobacteria bacterium]
MAGHKNLYIRTFGCQMNVHDSEQIEELLKEKGYRRTDNEKNADLIIINTCSIREKAEQKAYSLLGRFRKLKEINPGLIIGIGGCVAQQMGADLIKKAPYLDLVFGTHNIHRLPAMLQYVQKNGNRAVETSFHESVKSLGIQTLPRHGRVRSYVTIMQGCNNFCSFCVVPYLRGREESRDSSDIINEIKFLADHGIREITLLGQNVNSYGKTLHNSSNFPSLLKKIGDEAGIERIRFTTSHPKDLSDDLIACFAEVDSLCKHIHLPVQSGSDYILQRMNRHYTSKEYLKKVEKLRDVCSNISITSDIIVGFPGEKDNDFQKTIDLMEKVRFDNTFSFKYSVRSGTAAERYDDKVPESVKSKRLEVVQSLQKRHTLESNRALEGRVEDILVEGYSKNKRTDVVGRTGTNKIVNFKASGDIIGTIVRVKITKAYINSLRGKLIAKRRGIGNVSRNESIWFSY